MALCFTTADSVEHEPSTPVAPASRLSNALIDIVVHATAESTHEATLNAMCITSATPDRVFLPGYAHQIGTLHGYSYL